MELVINTKCEALVNYKRDPTVKNLAALRTTRSNTQRTVRDCANQYWLNLCQDIQLAADARNMRGIHKGLRKSTQRKSSAKPLTF